MSWRLVYIENADEMRLYLDNLKITKEEQDILIPLGDIHTILVDNQQTQITAKLLNKLAEYHIMIVFCNDEHMPNAFSMGIYSHYKVYGNLYKQMNWSQQQKEEIWKEIISAKIINQSNTLNLLKDHKEDKDKLSNLAKLVIVGDKENREGQAARIYFQALFGKDFTRQRDAVDTINAALNYSYAILRAVIARVIVAHGLHPALGVGHRNQFNAFNLADDLMEVYRPIVDYWVINTIQFAEYLTKELKLLLMRNFSSAIIIDNKKQMFLHSIEIYIHSFIRKMNENSQERLLIPNGIVV